jgi:hypothetical protein
MTNDEFAEAGDPRMDGQLTMPPGFERQAGGGDEESVKDRGDR